jgi:hypothetical protein
VVARQYATNQTVAGSIPDDVIFLDLPNISNLAMALEFTRPLTEMSTIKFSWGVSIAGA